MTLLFGIYTVSNPKLIGLVYPLSSVPSGTVPSLGLKKRPDTVFFVQGLEVVIPYQCHSSQQVVAKQTNVSLTSDMFLVWGQGIGIKRT